MSEEQHIASQIATIIKEKYPERGTTLADLSQNLREKGIKNASISLISKLFKGTYPISKKSPFFKQFFEAFGKQRFKTIDDYWKYLLETTDLSSAKNKEQEKSIIRIGLNHKNFWARPFAKLLIDNNLPQNMEITYGQLVEKTFGEDFHVKEKKIIRPLTTWKLSVPPVKSTKIENIEDEKIQTEDDLYDWFSEKKTNGKADLTGKIDNYKVVSEEWFMSQSLIQKLKKGELQIIANPKSQLLENDKDIIPICRITSGYSAQILLIQRIKKNLFDEFIESTPAVNRGAFKIRKEDFQVVYNPYFAADMDKAVSRKKYLERLETDIFSTPIAENPNNYFRVRTIKNSLSGEVLTKLHSVIEAEWQKEELLSMYAETMKLEIPKEEQAKIGKWKKFYELLTKQTSKPINIYSEDIMYKKQLKHRVVQDVIEKDGQFMLVGFSPYMNKILLDVVKYFRKNPENGDYTLKILRYNLSDMLGERITTSLYAQKYFIRDLIKNDKISVLDQLYQKLTVAVEEMGRDHTIKKKLAMHNFYFENLDRELDTEKKAEEIEKMQKCFEKEPEQMDVLLNEYDSAEKMNEFRYKIVRTDEYAKFLEELLAEKK